MRCFPNPHYGKVQGILTLFQVFLNHRASFWNYSCKNRCTRNIGFGNWIKILPSTLFLSRGVKLGNCEERMISWYFFFPKISEVCQFLIIFLVIMWCFLTPCRDSGPSRDDFKNGYNHIVLMSNEGLQYPYSLYVLLKDLVDSPKNLGKV